MLRTQYRCHPDIGEVANRVVYAKQLQHGTPAEKRPALVPHWAPLRLLDTAAGEEQAALGGSYHNAYEARLAAKLVHFVCSHGRVNASQVGVIALYKAQAVKIREALQAYTGSTASFDQQAVQISTVDAFQGGEKDIVIVSCVRTSSTGFIDDLGRINVAVTRARHHLLLLGGQGTGAEGRESMAPRPRARVLPAGVCVEFHTCLRPARPCQLSALQPSLARDCFHLPHASRRALRCTFQVLSARRERKKCGEGLC